MSQPKLQLIKTATTTTTTIMTTTIGGEAGMIVGVANIDVDIDINIHGEITNVKRNTDIYPTMVVVSAMMGMTNLMVKVVDTRGSSPEYVNFSYSILSSQFFPTMWNYA